MTVPSVIELLKQRISGQSDNYHLALSVEGGLLRGAISAGMIEALDDHGAGKYFDSFWGTSIGALNAAYLAAGETAGRSELYVQAVDSDQGGLYRRPGLTSGWLDLEWLFDQGFDRLQPLPWERLPGSKLRFLLTSSRWWEAREAVSYFRPQNGSNYRQLLQTACQAPIATGLPFGSRRRQLWDAAVFENWPQATVWKHGATHLLVLRSTPEVSKEALHWRAYSRAFNWLFCTPSYQQQDAELKRLVTAGRAAAIYPQEQLIALHERDSDKVRQAIELGRQGFERFWSELQ